MLTIFENALFYDGAIFYPKQDYSNINGNSKVIFIGQDFLKKSVTTTLKEKNNI